MEETQPKWFYELSGKRVGPVSEAEIIELIKTNIISYGDSVWTAGYSDWVNVEQSEFKHHLILNTPPPLSGGKINNTLVWLLAFAPIISVLLIFIILGVVYEGSEYRMLKAYYSGEFWWVAIIVNILLSLCDESILKKSGHDTSKFRGWVWLVPVYLFQRAKILKQNNAYFIVWIVCFAVSLLV